MAFFSFQSSKSYSFIGAILGSIFVGASPIFVRLSEIDPLATGFFRFFIALPFLWIWTIFNETTAISPPNTKSLKDYFLLAGSGVFFACDIALWHYSLNETSVINSTLLNNMTPIFVMLMSWLILRETVSWPSFLGMALALVGVFCLVLSEGEIGCFRWLGDGLALLSAIFYAGYVLIVKRLRHRFEAPVIMTWSSFSCMYCLALLSFFNDTHIIPKTGLGWLPLIGLGFIVHALGQGLIAYALRHLSAAFSSVTMMITPVVSAIVAWQLFGESLTALKIVGASIVLAGIIVARQNEI